MNAGIQSALRAGAFYFAVVFAAGFVLGALRMSTVAPRIGDTPAALLEAPLMLAASWAACGWALRRIPVPPATGARLAMGGVAFGLLMGAEAVLSAILGTGPRAWLAGLGTPAGAIGLSAQVAFAALPLFRSTT